MCFSAASGTVKCSVQIGHTAPLPANRDSTAIVELHIGHERATRNLRSLVVDSDNGKLLGFIACTVFHQSIHSHGIRFEHFLMEVWLCKLFFGLQEVFVTKSKSLLSVVYANVRKLHALNESCQDCDTF